MARYRRRRAFRSYVVPAPAGGVPVEPPVDSVIIERFAHPGDFARAADDQADPSWRTQERSDWCGGNSFAGAVRDCTRGKTDTIEQARALFDAISFEVPTPRSTWMPSVCGAYPIVPAFLSGHPETMRRRVRLACESAPIGLYLDLTSSGGVAAEHLQKRGIAFLALAMALSSMRPVSLYAVIPQSVNGSLGPHILTTINIPSAPLDLASACGLLTNPASVRLLGYGYNARRLGGGGNWYRNNFAGLRDAVASEDKYSGFGRDTYSMGVRRDLGIGDGDFYMPGAGFGDPLTDDPVAFISRAVKEAAALDDDGAR